MLDDAAAIYWWLAVTLAGVVVALVVAHPVWAIVGWVVGRPCSCPSAAPPLSSDNVSGGGLSAPSGPAAAILTRNSVSPACES